MYVFNCVEYYYFVDILDFQTNVVYDALGYVRVLHKILCTTSSRYPNLPSDILITLRAVS